ncbi:hypothetical protein BGZ74_011714 [Mortierella antarctica]|nr:hypothetical protein BGZ74_011714 [Mortierella antarctica]
MVKENNRPLVPVLGVSAEKQMQDQGSYRSEIRQREATIKKCERELYTVLLERDADVRKRLDEELATKKEKEEFYLDIVRKKEELRNEIDKVRNEREKYFEALAEIKALKKELQARTFVAPSKLT